MKTTLSLFFILYLLISSNCFGQIEIDNPDSLKAKPATYRVIMQDGNQYVGTIIDQTQDTIRFKTSTIGIITIPVKQMSSIEEITNSKSIDGRPYHFQTTNYLTLNSAYGLKKGEGYYKNVTILFNNISYGVTDNFSIGVGTLASFLFGGSVPVWLTSRLTIPVVENKLNIGGGAILGSIESSPFAIFYGVTTFGTRDANISLGLGSGSPDGSFSDPFFNFNSNLRVTNRFYFLAESYLLDDEFLMLIGGRSILGRGSIEYGLLMSNSFDFLGIPIIGFTVPLHK